MVGTAIEFTDLADCVRDKFGIRRRFKMKIMDEDAPDGDMITLGDQDDLDMAVQSVVGAAKRQWQDIAKMEVSFPFVVGAVTRQVASGGDFLYRRLAGPTPDQANHSSQIWIFDA